MKISNITKELNKIGNYYNQISDSRKFAYYKASSLLLNQFGKDFDVNEFYDFTGLCGIGDIIQSKIMEIISGKIPEELSKIDKSEDSSIISTLSLLEQSQLHKFGITNDDDIKSAAIDPILYNVLPDSIINILGRTRVNATIITLIKIILNGLIKDSTHLEILGSYRRKLPTIKDLDFLCSKTTRFNGEEFIEYLNNQSVAVISLNNGDMMKRYLFAYNGFKIKSDIKIVPQESFGSAMLHFTGPSKLNIISRSKVKSQGWLLNEYGLYNPEGINTTANMSEKMIIEILNNQFSCSINQDPTKRF